MRQTIALITMLGSWLVLGCGTTVDPNGNDNTQQAPDIAELGLPAPSFTIADTDGVTRSLDALVEQGPVVLFFFCNT